MNNTLKTMNILHIHGHDGGRMFSPYGYNTDTPRLQRLAEEGATFRQAFCAAPTCSPSRAALMTGQYPHCCGMHELANLPWGFQLDDYSRHLAAFLGRNGYETALAGVQHEIDGAVAPLEGMGYEHWLNHDDRGKPDRQTTLSSALGFLAEPHERPFFLSVGFGEPHRDNQNLGRRHGYDEDLPFVEQADGRYTRPPAPIPDTPLTRQDWATFRDGAARLDAKMGAVFDAIDRAGLRENTLVIATCDHGIAWPHGKGNLTDLGLGVMLILRGPSGTGFEGGKVIDAMVSHMDLFPTLCELAGLEAPDWLQGLSLLPLVDGRANSLRDHLFAEQGYHCQRFDPQRAIRSERYKYIRRKAVDHIRIVDPGPTNDWMRSLGYPKRPEGTELLYDLWFDPQELNNLADDPAHAGVLEDLSKRLDRWMEETEDPFATDSIPPPRTDG